MEQRITYPPQHTAYDNKQDDADSLMHHYVTNNVINPVLRHRMMQSLVLGINGKRGETLIWALRYKNLAEELTEIGDLSGLGWNIELDYHLKQYIFKVLEGRNLSTGQSVHSPVIFSPEFNSLGQLTYTESELDFKNVAIVAGQGEGVDRRIIEVGAGEGFDRYELFVDARDVEEEIQPEEGQENPIPRPEADIIRDLTNRGNRDLAEHAPEVYMEGQVLTKSPFVYQKDYELGDIVTLQNRDWGITTDARIIEAKEIYEGNGRRIELGFGNKQPTLLDKIGRELSVMGPEIKR